MTDTKNVTRALHILALYPFAFAWTDFGDKGNPCYQPYIFASKDEEIAEALTFAAVRISMPKYSNLHKTLARAVANQLGCKFVKYDWLIKVCARILSESTYETIRDATLFAVNVQSRLKKYDTPPYTL